MSTESIENAVERFKTEAMGLGAMYVLPDGTMLDLSMLENGHADFWKISGCSDIRLKALGWMRLNTKLKYVEMPSRITAAQSARLEQAMAFMGDDVQIK